MDSAAGLRLHSIPPALPAVCLAVFAAGSQVIASMAKATRIYSAQNKGFPAALGGGSLAWQALNLRFAQHNIA